MNQFGPSPSSYEQTPTGENTQPMNEIPSYPVSPEQLPQVPVQAQQPASEQYIPTPVEVAPQPKPFEAVPTPATIEQQTYNVTEAQKVPVSEVPELQTPVEYKITKEGRIFNNPNLGQATFKGGVTSTQVVSKVGGYTISPGLVADPHSGLLQQTATTGSPTQSLTWQSLIVFKALQSIWKALGLI